MVLVIRGHTCVVVETHGEVILDEIFARSAHVHGIPIFELCQVETIKVRM